MKLYDKLWVCQQPKLDEQYRKQDGKLSYMCQVSNDAGFKKRQETGRLWSLTRDNEKDITLKGIENTYPNEPMTGFKLGKSVTRWSTSNKLFRLEDPRCFIVEISTGNLEMLMRDVTIKNCEILEECLWARDGSNNVLVSVNSQPYKDSISMAKVLAGKSVPLKQIEVGDKVQMKNGKIFVYAGKLKHTVEYNLKEYVPWGKNPKDYDQTVHTHQVETEPKTFWIDEDGNGISYKSPSVVAVLSKGNEVILDLDKQYTLGYDSLKWDVVSFDHTLWTYVDDGYPAYVKIDMVE